MAKTESTDNTVQKQAQENKTVAVFEKSEIIQNAGNFGTTPEIMAGALATLDKDLITKQEAKDAVAAFIKRPVERSK